MLPIIVSPQWRCKAPSCDDWVLTGQKFDRDRNLNPAQNKAEISLCFQQIKNWWVMKESNLRPAD